MSGQSAEESDDEGVPCNISVRRNADGTIHVYKWNDHKMPYFGEYQWTDGNFGCDCNRYLFFCRAAGEDEEDEYPCGDDRYSVRIEGIDGGILFSDWD